MMTRPKNRFSFTPFSRKQLQVLSWWRYPKTRSLDAIVCDGSVRAGKTVVMSLSYVLWSMATFDGQQFGMAGKTIGSFRRNVLRPLKQMLTSEGYTVLDSRTENMLTIAKGSHTNYYFIFGGKDEASQDLVQGITLAGFFFDEVALMPQSFVSQATARCSVSGAKLWFNCNPEGPYHWFKVEYIDQLAEKRALRIHFQMEDNPSLSPDVIARYHRAYSGVFYQRYILGLWVLSDGVVYSNFERDTMVAELPEDAVPEKYWISVDYGTQNPTVFLLWGLYHGVWYCMDEYYYSGRGTGKQKTDEQYADDLEDFYYGYGIGRHECPLIVDPSAASFKKALRNRGFKVVNANNDVITGIRFAMTAMNCGQIKFSERCQNLIKEFSSYVWDEKAAQRGIDAVVKEHDHACDAMRYFCMHVLYKRPGKTVQLFKGGI